MASDTYNQKERIVFHRRRVCSDGGLLPVLYQCLFTDQLLFYAILNLNGCVAKDDDQKRKESPIYTNIVSQADIIAHKRLSIRSEFGNTIHAKCLSLYLSQSLKKSYELKLFTRYSVTNQWTNGDNNSILQIICGS